MTQSLFGSACFNSQRTLVDRLRAVGLDKYIELPQIAVMGDTSSGKSSVLSAISGITFPSSSVLTTRCPTQLILSEAKTFSGTVRLKRFKSREDEFLEPKTLSSPDEIETEITRLTTQLVSEGQDISDDAIIIEVGGPDYPNLTLTDLPGLVRTVEDGEDFAIIGRVRALVDRYLVQSRTVILAVVPANVDMHNTEILQAAQAADPQGIRTISIITKPDLIDPGAEAQVIELLMNRKKTLKLGYHAVKCRGQKDLEAKLSISQGIVRENKFFADHDVWGRVDPSYVGIHRLTDKLVKILEDIIARSLPAVLKEIDSRLAKCKVDLNKLGVSTDSVSSRRLFYHGYVESVQKLLRDSVDGNYEDKFFSSFQPDNRARALIRKKEPEFRDAIAKTQAFETYATSTTVLVGDLVEVDFESEWLPRRVALVAETKISHDGTNMIEADKWRQIPSLDLSQLKLQIQDNRGDELAIFPSYNLFCNLVRSYVRTWEEPMFELLNGYESILSGVSHRALDQAMPSKFYKVKEFVGSIMSQAFESAKSETVQVLKEALKSECRPYTLNHFLFELLVKLRNEPLLKSLEGLCASKTNRNVSLDAVLAVLKNHGAANVSNEDREAMELHTTVKAYLQVSKKRFTDTIPMAIQNHFVDGVLKHAKLSLSGASDQQLEVILLEPLSTVNYRAQLVAQLNSLEDSKKEIAGSYYGIFA
ncbi:hypothetical protein HDU98_012013 [Podochytrium sp. JEL0797]|nr:hypothetical protein HDU98_012013 [Podochytrium sp. JEL0797]